MYQIKCDDYILYDPRIDDRTILNPRCKLKENTVCEASFTILNTHPYYGQLKKLKSIFEIQQDGNVIFRGRMTGDSKDIDNRLDVDLEGVLGFTNDTLIPPFNFPDDFPEASNADNVIKYFLQWILDKHNECVEDWQQLKLGNVTVSDPNNYISRSSEKYDSTWNTLKSKLFDSSLGGYIVIRYEDDGNYIDYVDSFELTNTQSITFGENLLDITSKSDASETYSAILPMGKDGLTIESLPDGDLSDDIVKKGKYIYSKSAVASYGWICVPIDDSTWSDVTVASNLQTKAVEHLSGNATMLSGTITFKSLDLHFTDDQIQSFRIYRNVLVNAPLHGISNASYRLTELNIDMLNPQNTTITVGNTFRSLVDINSNTADKIIQSVKNDLKEFEQNVDQQTDEIYETILEQSTEVLNSAESIILSALEKYVETSNYEEFKETVQTQLEVLAGEITMKFNTTTEHIEDVNGDLQSKFTEIYNYITFSEDGITLGSNENAITLTIEHDRIAFKKNNVTFGSWDGNNFYTGNIVVEVNERAQFGNFAFIPRSDGSLSFLKVGE